MSVRRPAEEAVPCSTGGRTGWEPRRRWVLERLVRAHGGAGGDRAPWPRRWEPAPAPAARPLAGVKIRSKQTPSCSARRPGGEIKIPKSARQAQPKRVCVARRAERVETSGSTRFPFEQVASQSPGGGGLGKGSAATQGPQGQCHANAHAGEIHTGVRCSPVC